jgi:hypothetical protein
MPRIFLPIVFTVFIFGFTQSTFGFYNYLESNSISLSIGGPGKKKQFKKSKKSFKKNKYPKHSSTKRPGGLKSTVKIKPVTKKKMEKRVKKHKRKTIKSSKRYNENVKN